MAFDLFGICFIYLFLIFFFLKSKYFKYDAERRKIERTIRRLEKQQRLSSDHASEEKISVQLFKLKEDLEYVSVRSIFQFLVKICWSLF